MLMMVVMKDDFNLRFVCFSSCFDIVSIRLAKLQKFSSMPESAPKRVSKHRCLNILTFICRS